MPQLRFRASARASAPGLNNAYMCMHILQMNRRLVKVFHIKTKTTHIKLCKCLAAALNTNKLAPQNDCYMCVGILLVRTSTGEKKRNTNERIVFCDYLVVVVCICLPHKGIQRAILYTEHFPHKMKMWS